jgi:hypothetical protein
MVREKITVAKVLQIGNRELFEDKFKIVFHYAFIRVHWVAVVAMAAVVV